MRALLLPFCLLWAAAAAAAPRLVAAEAVYADIARQIAGVNATVTALLTNPDQDPHLFEAGPAAARALTGAAIVIYNGDGYDPWMRDLLAATGGAPRRVIDVADLVRAAPGGNPHLWYDPRTMKVVAQAIARALADADPPHRADYTARLAALQTSLAALTARVESLRTRFAGQPVTATEPVFGLMLDALGLQDRDQAFQRAVMNDTEPSAADIAAIEGDLRGHRVRALLRNTQTDDALTFRLVAIARAASVPVVGVTETLPGGLTYQSWVLRALDALAAALANPPAPSPARP